MIMDSFKAGAWISVLSRYPYLIGLLPRLVPKKMMDARNKHMQFSEDKVVKLVHHQNRVIGREQGNRLLTAIL